MDIDKLISGFDFVKFKKDCILHSILSIYVNKKSALYGSTGKDADLINNQLHDLSDILKKLFRYAKCFPSMCEDCQSLKKCINCILQNNCADASIEMLKLKHKAATI